jgi:hypothetical protein
MAHEKLFIPGYFHDRTLRGDHPGYRTLPSPGLPKVPEDAVMEIRTCFMEAREKERST